MLKRSLLRNGPCKSLLTDGMSIRRAMTIFLFSFLGFFEEILLSWSYFLPEHDFNEEKYKKCRSTVLLKTGGSASTLYSYRSMSLYRYSCLEILSMIFRNHVIYNLTCRSKQIAFYFPSHIYTTKKTSTKHIHLLSYSICSSCILMDGTTSTCTGMLYDSNENEEKNKNTHNHVNIKKQT